MSREKKVLALLERQFPELFDTDDTFKDALCDLEEEIAEHDKDEDKAQLLRARSLALELDGLQPAQINKLYSELLVERYRQARKDFFKKRSPPDWEQWASFPDVSIDEAATLLFGGDPETVDWNSVERSGERSLATEYTRLHRLAKNACREVGSDGRLKPGALIVWLRGKKLPHGKELETALERQGKIVNWQDRCLQLELALAEKEAKLRAALTSEAKPNKSAETRSVANVLQLFLAAAAPRYDIDPYTALPPDIQEPHLNKIRADFGALGLTPPVDKTLRKWVKQAVEVARQKNPKRTPVGKLK